MGSTCSSSSSTLPREQAPSHRRSLDPGQINVLEAAALGDAAELRRLLDGRASVDAADYDSRSALHLACSEGHVEAASLLLSRGARVDVKNRWGHEPLQEAMVNGHRQVAELLARAGAALSSECAAELELRLCHLAARGDAAGVRHLLDARVSAASADYNGRSALHLAAERGFPEAVALLVAAGAAVDARDRSGETPLSLAAAGGHAATVAALRAAGAAAEASSPPPSLAAAAAAAAAAVSTPTLGGGASPTGGTLANGSGGGGGGQGLGSMSMRPTGGGGGGSPDVGSGRMSAVAAAWRADRDSNASFAVMEAFPQPVATAMLEGRRVEPISKDMVSVMFSDIIGFSALSSAMPAAKVSRMLGRLFGRFDRLAQAHGVQKVDVIGDAYIAATNFLQDQSQDHAARLARFALDAMTAAAETPLDDSEDTAGGTERECVQIRVGMHCGPVSGCVVGSQVFKYTLMGDTVNTASRMESTSVAARIQCSEISAVHIARQAPDITLMPRVGGVHVKGKGHMQTYWVSPPVSGGAGGAAALLGTEDSAMAAGDVERAAGPDAPAAVRRPSGPAPPGAIVTVVSVSLPDPLSFPGAPGVDDSDDPYVLEGLPPSLPLRAGATAIPALTPPPFADAATTERPAPEDGSFDHLGRPAGRPDLDFRVVPPPADGPATAGAEFARARPGVVRARSHIIRM